MACDVRKDDDIEGCFGKMKEEGGGIEGIGECIGFGKKEEVEGD